MDILVLNSGSSSLKFKLFRMPRERELAAGLVERIGEEAGAAVLTCTQPACRRQVDCRDHVQALALILSALRSGHKDDPPAVAAIQALGHRLVHGGTEFDGPVLVDDRVLDRLEALAELAPLHMPPALSVVRACRTHLPQAAQVACFDTTFYRSMPAKSFRYAVPRQWYTDHGLRRFGFHGLSHEFVTLRSADILGIPLSQLKLISAHLGNGASITAFDRGRVLDTSMGFTPLEGLMMGTRAGFLDPAALPYLRRRTGMDLDRLVDLLNTSSGLTAISGHGRDMRTIMAARHRGDTDATLAVEMYVHTLRKYIGAYFFALNGAHALVFTGGVGTHAAGVRALVLNGWEELGMSLDPHANDAMVSGRNGLISPEASRVKVLVIPTDEERLIARQTYARVRQPN